MSQAILNVKGCQEGISFNVKIIKKWDKYGKDDSLTYDGNVPLVEFYDARYAEDGRFDPEGQFVSRYYKSTLLEHNTQYALNLQGGVPDWIVPSWEMEKVINWIKEN